MRWGHPHGRSYFRVTSPGSVGHRPPRGARSAQGPRWGRRPRGAQQDPAHLLGVCTSPIQEQGVEHILPSDEEPVAVLIQVQGAEAEEALVAEEKDGAVGAQKLCQGGREASGGAILAQSLLTSKVPSQPPAQVLASSLGDVLLPGGPQPRPSICCARWGLQPTQLPTHPTGTAQPRGLKLSPNMRAGGKSDG